MNNTSSIIEFKLFDEKYCFNTQNVAYVFELEEYNDVGGFHDAVIGLTKYNNDIMLLIDTAKLYSNKSLDMSKEKSVIVIYDAVENRHYGMLVDEIIKLEEVEDANPSVSLSTKEMIIKHYKDEKQHTLINEIYPLPLLLKHHIPAMTSLHFNKNQNIPMHTSTTTKHYLLVRIDKHFYAVASEYVKEVLENEFSMFTMQENIRDVKGAIALREEIVQVIDFQNAQKNDLLILEHNGLKMALEVDEVYDIEDFDTEKIEYIKDSPTNIEAFYNHNEQVIAILNPLYYLQEKSSPKTKKSDIPSTVNSFNYQEYLIFYIDKKAYSISMQNVRQVIESETLAKTNSSAIAAKEYIKFLTTWNHQAVSVIKLDTFLHVNTKETATQIIFVESDKKIMAFLVDDIDNIVYLDKSAVSEIKCNHTEIISGAIMYNDEVIVTLNEKFLAGLV